MDHAEPQGKSATPCCTFSSVTFNVHHEDGMYWAEVVELPGCLAAGETIEELIEAMAEALKLVLSAPA